MHFSRSLLVLAAPLLALAQSNPFKIPEGFAATAGQPLDLSWTPTTSGTVSLVLRSGASSNLLAGTTIATNLDNSGSYTWHVPSSITRGSDYAIEIVDDSDPTMTNFTPYFVLDSTNTVASSTAVNTIGAVTTSVSLSTASPTGSATSVAAAISSSASSSSASAASSGSAASTASTASGSASSGSQTTMATATTGSSTSAGAASAATSALVSGTSSAGASRATMVGMVGALALGAFAL